jgi:hypothetical protein
LIDKSLSMSIKNVSYNYDPVLGRMNGVDPMATKYASLTPYNFLFNDPVTFTDVSGADPENPYDANGAPILEYYTTSMYHPTYGWIQDDHMYERVTGWTRVTQFGFNTDWMFGKAGTGLTGLRSWQVNTFEGGFNDWVNGRAHAASILNGISSGLASEFGGNVSARNGSFTAFDQFGSMLAGMDYVDRTKSWDQTIMKSAAGTWAYYEASQSMLNPDYGSMCACLPQELFANEGLSNKYYTVRGDYVRAERLFGEFLTGEGPERSLFFGSHKLTTDMKKSAVMRRAKAFYSANYPNGGDMRLRHTNYYKSDIPFKSDIEQLVGSARVSIYPRTSHTIFVIDNTTSRHSGSYDKIPNIPRTPGQLTPTGNIYQRFIWIEWKSK